MYSFFFDVKGLISNGLITAFLVFSLWVWIFWSAKMILARRYRPFTDPTGFTTNLRTTVIVPVYNEPEEVFRQVLSSVKDNGPTEIIVVVDGADPDIADVARDYADIVIPMPKAGKRQAIDVGLSASDPTTDVVLVLDSDTIWETDMLEEILKPFADPTVGGVSPSQRIIDPDANVVRRIADWVEDIRFSITVQMQSHFNQVGCLAGRTIAYRRAPFEIACSALQCQSVFGMKMEIGDDRVLTNEILSRDWKTVYQSTAKVLTDAPNTWRVYFRQQLRWARSSQRETFLSARWLWRKPVACITFINDMVTPFAVYALYVIAVASIANKESSHLPEIGLWLNLLGAFIGMLVSVGLRQTPHFIRKPKDLLLFPLFAVFLTAFMVPVRIMAFATMFHQKWSTRDSDEADRSLVGLTTAELR